MNSRHLLPALAIIAASASMMAGDIPGAGDHPLVKRVEGSEIFFSKAEDFDKLKISLGKLEWISHEAVLKPYESATVEGKRLTNYYMAPAGMSVLEVLRNYEQELKENGFEILHIGQGDEIETPGYNNQMAREILGMTGNYGTPEEKAQWPFQHTEEKKAGYVAAKKTTESGEVFVTAYIVPNTHDKWLDIPVDRTLVRLDVCEVKARQQRMELVTSGEMAGEIAMNGRIALYGILFDFDKATLRPDSEPTLVEIARLLNEKPGLKILVVGHTDATGSFEYNRGLSQKRAESVVANLTAKGISKERLFPVGVAFASPVATNATEDGKAKNRRVELVDMASGRPN